MRGIFCGFIFVWVAGMLFAATKSGNVPGDNFIDYSEGEDSFAVLYIDSQNAMTEKEAKKLAMERAAEVTVQKGYRYFQVASERPVLVQRTTSDGPRTPTNLYQEMIVERDFGVTAFEKRRNANAPVGTYSAYKIVFQCSKTKFPRKSVDACSLTRCY